MHDETPQQRQTLWDPASSALRMVLILVLFAAAVCLVQRLTFLLRFPPFQRTAIWTPGAIIFAALLIAPLRQWWVYYVGICLAAVGAYFNDNVIPLSTVLFGVQFLFVGMAFGAWVIRRHCSRPSLETPATFAAFVAFAVIVVPVTIEAPQAMIRLVTGAADVWAVAVRNVLGIAIGVLCGTPALTLALTRGRDWVRASSWRGGAELGAMAACLVTVGYVSFGRPMGGGTPPVMLYAPLPLLLWASTRFGLAGVSWAILVVAFQAVWGALHGRGPFTSPDPAGNILQLQLFLLAISLPLMVLAVITEEHRRAFSALANEMAMHKQADERFRLVVESSPSAIVMVDVAGTVVLVNAQIEKYFGYGPTELVGQPIEILVPERFRGKHHDLLARFFSLPTARPIGAGYELFGRRKDGSEFPIDIGLTPVQTNEGLFCFGTIVDITEQKRAEETKMELSHAARLAVVGELSASIAHEINQPLGAILSNVDAAEILLASAPESLGEVRQILDDIRNDDLRASDVIRRVRALARKREIELQPLDLNSVISDTLGILRGEFIRRGVVIGSQLADDLPVVYGDKIHLQQILLNLFLNGMEAMADSTGPRRLFMRTAVDANGNVEAAVSDTGSGIRPDQMGRLFEPFYSTKKEGMGIGLSVARSLVEAHRGRIWAESNADGGATMRFTVPAGVRPPDPKWHDSQPVRRESTP